MSRNSSRAVEPLCAIRLALVVAAFASLSFAPPVSAGDFINKTVGTIRPPDGRPCTFFTLDGVPAADPATPNTAWMVIRQAAVGYKENLAVLMSAKLTGHPVIVTTTGTVVPECGHVEALVIQLP